MTEITNEFSGDLGTYKPVLTADGSYTVHSQAFNENCHSTSGSQLETLYTYLEQAHAFRLYLEGRALNILEVGFGIGTGLWLTARHLQARDTPIHFTSVELDEKLALLAIQKINGEILSHENNLIKGKIFDTHFTVIIGDATKTLPDYLKKFPQTFNVIYQDAFSPGRNPDLWTEDWFNTLASCCEKLTTLSTYSASHSIRKNLETAGFRIENKKGHGQKKSMTVAHRL